MTIRSSPPSGLGDNPVHQSATTPRLLYFRSWVPLLDRSVPDLVQHQYPIRFELTSVSPSKGSPLVVESGRLDTPSMNYSG